MNRVFAYAGWTAALVATACALWFALEGARKADEMSRVRGEVAALRADLQKARADVDALAARGEAAEKAAGTKKTGPPDTSAATPSLFESVAGMFNDSASAGQQKQVDMSALVKGLMKANSSAGQGGFAAMFEGPQGEQMMDMSAKFATRMQYDPFLNGLQISPEQKQQARDIINRYNSEIMRKGISALQGKGDFAAAGDDTKKLKDQMRAELRNVLGADGLAQFDAYQEEMPQRMLNQSMDMQLGMFAGGLTPENRTLVRDVLVQELLPGQPEPGAPPSPDEMANLGETQRAAFERALQRLQPELPPDQYTEVEGFVRRQQEMMDLVSSMMPNLMPKPPAPAAGSASAAQ